MNMNMNKNVQDSSSDDADDEHELLDSATKKNLATEMLSKLTFCVFDLETTGGNHLDDNIIEIGLVKVENLKITTKKKFLIKSDKKIPDFIQKLTSIHPQDLKNAPRIEEVIDEILEFMKDTILVAHNTAFDIPFFNSVLTRLSRPELTNKSICTNMMTKYLIPNLMNSNLGYMSKILGIKHKKAHRALDDAMATAELLLNYLNVFIDKNINKVNHLYYPRNRYELDRIHLKSKSTTVVQVEERLTAIKAPFLVTVKGKDGVILFALPSNNSDNDKKFTVKKIKALEWEIITVRIFGPFIECLIHFNNFFTKLDNKIRGDIIKYLWKEHLPELRPKAKTDTTEEDYISNNSSNEIGDFLIVNHLVPEQYLVYPIESLHKDAGLIFRYPGHQKKLLQFISSRSSKLQNNKLKRVKFHFQIRDFINNYLQNCKQTGEQLFIFNKSLPLKNTTEFLNKFDEYLIANPNPYNFPKEYVR